MMTRRNRLWVFACAVFPFAVLSADPAPDDGLKHAEALYKKQLWTDAEKAFLTIAGQNAKQPSVSAPALVKAGFCRLKTRNEKGAMDVFRQVLQFYRGKARQE